MTIFSIGHDIVENNRIASLMEKYKKHFINKILSDKEKEIFATKANKVSFLAKRFSAKEAFAKACGCGLRNPILLPRISIGNDRLGKPYFVFDDSILDYLENLGVNKWHLSISDEANLSSAFVILEKRHENNSMPPRIII